MKKRFMKITAVILICTLFILLPGCGQQTNEYEYTFTAMDTIININFVLNGGQKTADELAERCEALVTKIESAASRTLDESDVGKFNSSLDSSELGEYTRPVVEAAIELYNRSDGAYDITVAPLVELWKITSDQPFIPSQSDIDAALTHVGSDKLTLNGSMLYKSDPEAAIDLGGIAKGRALGDVVKLIREAGAVRALVSFGGNVATVGNKANGKKWRIGVRDPYDPSQVAGYILTDGGSIAVSGDYERYFEIDGVRYHHIFSSTNGYPVSNGIHSVAVLSDDSMLGDALSTAIFCGGIELAEKLYEDGYYKFEAVIIYSGGMYMTDQMKTMFEKA